MGERVEQIKEGLKQCFPQLKTDVRFDITSKATSKYNCIAWAYGIDDRWMWPNTGKYTFLDGVHFWPSDEIQPPSIDNFIKAFQTKGFECCDDGDYEENYQKIALYAKPEEWEICTHAARQKRDGSWTSKLGRECDIQHGTAYTIENKVYGKVRCFMRRLFV